MRLIGDHCSDFMITLNPNPNPNPSFTAERLLVHTLPSPPSTTAVLAAMSPPKQVKFKGPPKAEGRPIPLSESMVVQIQSSNVDLRIKQAMNHAVREAHQDACTGNFKAFQSPFRNYLLPVIPNPAQLDG